MREIFDYLDEIGPELSDDLTEKKLVEKFGEKRVKDFFAAFASLPVVKNGK